MHIVLWALQSPINIGMVLRTAEIYKVLVTVFDAHAVFDRPEALEIVSDFSCGALERHPPAVWRDAHSIRGSLCGRFVASAIGGDAVSIFDASLAPTDILLFGNEYDGLPDDVLASCEKRVCIPMPPGRFRKPRSKHPIDPKRLARAGNDGAPSLNVAVAASIVMAFAHAGYGVDAKPNARLSPASARG